MSDLPDVVDTEFRAPAGQSTELSKFMPVFTIEVLAERRKIIQQAFDLVMKPGIDYGVIPGTSGKPSLWKPGAEQLCTLFGFVPEYDIQEKVQDFIGENHTGEPFIYYLIECTLIKAGSKVGSAIGSCNSWEKRYRYRNAERVCPNCGKANIRPSKDGGFYCWKKTDGCGAQFEAADKRITGQDQGQKANPEIMDVVNTIVKQAQKRALVAAVLVATGASAFFTQDVEDISSVNKDVKEGDGYAKRGTSQGRTAHKQEYEDETTFDGRPPETDPQEDNYKPAPTPAVKWGDRFTELASLYGVDVMELAKVKGGKPWQRRLQDLPEGADLAANSYELSCRPLEYVATTFGAEFTPDKIRDVAEMALEITVHNLIDVTGEQWAKVCAWMESRKGTEEKKVA